MDQFFVAMVGFVLGGFCEDGHKGMNSAQLVVGDDRTGAVEDCNDDDQCNGVCKGKLRVLGAFGDLAESVGSRDCNCGSGGFVGIKFELDFDCRER